MGPAPGTMREDRGFSLIELMVVLVIMAILGATIVPQFAGTHDEVLLRASGRELASALTLSYSLAVSRQAPCRLVLDTAKRRWRIESTAPAFPEEEGGGGSRAGEFAVVRDVPDSEGAIDRRISLAVRDPQGEDRDRPRPREERREEPEAVLFRADGTAEPREIVLRDREGFGIALRVEPSTARVRVSAIAREEPR